MTRFTDIFMRQQAPENQPIRTMWRKLKPGDGIIAILVNIGSGNGFVHDDIKPSHEPTLNYRQFNQ